jgi:hypothetical protein
VPINFNPNLNHNDSLHPHEIEARARKRNFETREMVEKAYLTGDVPVTAAGNAADHSSVHRETAQAKKTRKDARTWWGAQSNDGSCDDD